MEFIYAQVCILAFDCFDTLICSIYFPYIAPVLMYATLFSAVKFVFDPGEMSARQIYYNWPTQRMYKY